MKKRILCIILAVIMVIAAIPAGVFASETSGTCGENTTWEIKNGTLIFSGTGAVQDYENGSSPWFESDNVVSVVFEEGITHIGDFVAFGLFYVTEVHLPSTLESMGFAAIKCGRRIEKFVVAEGNKNFYTDSQGALYNKVSNELLYVPGEFEGEFVIGKDVVVNDFDVAFSETRGITGFKVEEGHPSLKTDSVGALYSSDGKFLYLPRGFNGQYTVLAPTTEIPALSMWNVTELTKVTIPEGVTKIWNHAFEGSGLMSSIYLPSTLTYIYDSAFWGCTDLRDIYFAGTEEQWNAIEHNDADAEVYEGVTIHFGDGSTADKPSDGDGIEILESGSFSDTITWTLTSDGTLTLTGTGSTKHFDLGSNPLCGDTRVKKIVIEEGITGLGTWALSSYYQAKEIHIPSTLETIDFAALAENYSLVEFVISEGNTHFYTDSQGAFYEKETQTLMYIPGPFVGELVIHKDVKVVDGFTVFHPGVTKTVVEEGSLYFKNDSVGALYTTDGELLFLPYDYAGEYTVLEGTTSIYIHALMTRTELTKLTLVEGITEIQRNSFANCLKLKEIHLPKSLTSINDTAFRECVKLTDIYFAGTAEQWFAIEHHEEDSSVYADVTLHFADETEECEHKEETIPAVDAGCENTGLTEGTKCSVCGEILTPQTETPATGHSFGEWVEKDNVKERSCSVCGKTETQSVEIIYGDATGDGLTNALDATQILRYVNGKTSVISGIDKEELAKYLDINGDGAVNALDATQILRYVNGKTSAFDNLK